MHFVTRCDLLLGTIASSRRCVGRRRRRWISSCSSCHPAGHARFSSVKFCRFTLQARRERFFRSGSSKWAANLSFRMNEPVTFTPTFVWVDYGVEVGADLPVTSARRAFQHREQGRQFPNPQKWRPAANQRPALSKRRHIGVIPAKRSASPDRKMLGNFICYDPG